MFKLNNWNLSNDAYVTPKAGEAPIGGVNYVTFDITDLTAAPYTYVWSPSTAVADSETGNSFEIVAIFDDLNTASYLTMTIEDGTNKAGIQISKGMVSTIDGTYNIQVANTDGAEHRYTLTLQNGHLDILFDTVSILDYQVTAESSITQFLVGFPEAQNGGAKVQFRFIKCTKGIYRYVKAPDIDFELQIDSVDTFDSPNLHTYTKASFDKIPEVLDNWDPVSLICGRYNGSSYDFNGLVQAATVHLPPKQDQELYTFYYRVRFTGDKYTSDWSQTYLTERIKPTALAVIPDEISLVSANVGNTINDKDFLLNSEEKEHDAQEEYVVCEVLDETDRGYHSFILPIDYGTVVLPSGDLPDNFDVTIYNASANHMRIGISEAFEKDDTGAVVRYADYEIAVIDPWNVVQFVYSATDKQWQYFVMYKAQTFMLPPNITNTVFDAVYHYRIPAYDDVYTKAFDSGVVADITKGKAVAVDEFFGQLLKQKSNIDSFKADRDDFNARWKNIFGLDNSLFKNSAEMRDTMQVIIKNLKGEMLKTAMEVVIESITGAKPDIVEYKDKYFNILWSYNTIKKLPLEQTYYLYDENHPSFRMQPFIVYGGADKTFTWEIDIYDPYNLKYNQDLITEIIEMFKPAYSFAVVKFYSYEGVPYTKRYYYGIDNYLRSEYNK